MGKLRLKAGSGLMLRNEASPVICRRLPEESEADEASENLRISVKTNGFSRTVRRSKDPVRCLNAGVLTDHDRAGLESPERKSVSSKRNRPSKNRQNDKKNVARTACKGTSANGNPQFEGSVSQPNKVLDSPGSSLFSGFAINVDKDCVEVDAATVSRTLDPLAVSVPDDGDYEFIISDDDSSDLLGNRSYKAGSSLMQRTSVSPVISRRVHKESPADDCTVSNENLRISVRTDGLSRSVLPTKDSVSVLTNHDPIGLESPGSKSISLKRKRTLASGKIGEGNADWKTRNRTPDKSLQFEGSVSKEIAVLGAPICSPYSDLVIDLDSDVIEVDAASSLLGVDPVIKVRTDTATNSCTITQSIAVDDCELIISSDDDSSELPGKFHFKADSGSMQQNAVSPVISRSLDGKSEANHCVSNEDLRISFVSNGTSRNVLPTKDPGLESPEIKSISPRNTRLSKNGQNGEDNADWRPFHGTSADNNLLFKDSISKEITVIGSPRGSLSGEHAIDTDNDCMEVDAAAGPADPVTNVPTDTVDTVTEYIAIDSDHEFVISSDDDSDEQTERFDRFAPSEGRAVPKKVPSDVIIDRVRSIKPLEESPRHVPVSVSRELLLEASASYRKRKVECTIPETSSPILSPVRPEETTQKSALPLTQPDDDVITRVRTGEEQVPSVPSTSCKLPFNGHREDEQHYRHCEVVLAGIVFRDEHAKWLSNMSLDSKNMRVIDSIIGRSCKEIILKDNCCEEQCKSEHKIDLNFKIPEKLKVFELFTKWFLQNATHPNFKAIWTVLSCIPNDHPDMFMIILTYANMIVKLSKSGNRQALGIKLIGVMVKIMEFTREDAVRTLLAFTVTSETNISEIGKLLSSLHLTHGSEFSKSLYESMSCLWHINENFSCPANLLLKVLKDSLEEMPPDVKLTKDRLVVDLKKLPRRRLRRDYLSIEKFLGRYYPQNSEVAHAVRASVLYGVDVLDSSEGRQKYETSRVKGTGPVNPQWDYWDVREAQINSFDLVMKNSRKENTHEDTDACRGPIDLTKENLYVDVWRHDLFKIVSSRNCLDYDRNSPYDFSPLVDALTSLKYSKVVKMISTFAASNAFQTCLRTLQRELELCDKSLIGIVVFEILLRLPGSFKDKASAKSGFVSMVNSLAVNFYKQGDYRSALKLLKAMRLAGTNHLDHKPEQISRMTFAVVCSDVNFQCRLYPEAIRSLMYKDVLNFLEEPSPDLCEQFGLLEKVVKSMLQRFLKERHSSRAMDIFRLVFRAQKSLHSPLDIGRYYEGVLFLSFVGDLKNPCYVGSGANLYVTVDKICGNSERFHAITYRSLLVELHRANSPEDVLRRTLQICLKRRIYPDFSLGPISLLVLDSHLAREEMLIYFKHYFAYSVAQNRQNATPMTVRFRETPLSGKKLFPVSNDVMKTPRTIPEALERLKSVLDEIVDNNNDALGLTLSQDSATIPVATLERLHRVFKC